MNIQVQAGDQHTIVSLQGELAIRGLEDTRDALLGILGDARSSVIIRMDGISRIDSSGIALLVALLHRAKALSKRLILCSLEPPVEKVFIITNLTRIFDIAPTLKEALEIVYPFTIFLFEDRTDIVFFYQELIQANHMVFHCRNTVEESLTFLQENQVHLILVDSRAREQRKYDFVRALKQDPQLMRIPVVVLSVYEEEEFHYSQFGVDRFILKPFRLEDFISTVKTLCAGQRMGN